MPRTTFDELLDAGVHFGHLKRKWNPAMAPYVFMERNGIHIIDLHKTIVKLEESANALRQIAKSGRNILFVATKKQAKDIVAKYAKSVGMPYVTERWSGGMLTNFPTIRKAVKKMTDIDKMEVNGTFKTLSKRERLQITRQRAKLEKNLGSIADMTRQPSALFIVDVNKEKIAVREAKRLQIPIFGIVDTNSSPDIDFVIPANDDAAKSIELIISIVTKAIQEGIDERKSSKDSQHEEDKTADKPKRMRARKNKTTKQKTEQQNENNNDEQNEENLAERNTESKEQEEKVQTNNSDVIKEENSSNNSPNKEE